MFGLRGYVRWRERGRLPFYWKVESFLGFFPEDLVSGIGALFWLEFMTGEKAVFGSGAAFEEGGGEAEPFLLHDFMTL